MQPTPRSPAHTVALLATLALAGMLGTACGDPSGLDGRDARVEAIGVVDSLGPLTRSLRVELGGEAAVEVFYAPAGDPGRAFRMTSDPATSHEILLPRLLAGTEYRYAARPFDADGTGEPTRGTFTTGDLPADLATLDYTVEGEGTFPLVIFGHRVDDGFRGLVAMEPDGSIVWFTTEVARGLAPTPIPGSHDMLVITREGVEGIARIAPTGRVVNFMARERVPAAALHHDIAVLDERRVVMLVRDERPVADTVVAGEAIWQWDLETDAVEKLWSSWDHFDWELDRGPRSRPDDWLHANSISVGPRGNLIVSLHYLNQVISIAPDYQKVEWRLGGTNATVGVAEEDRFEGQHSAFELDDGHILLFDNQYRARNDTPAETSRGLELEVTGDSAHAVWRYVPDPPVWARIISGIYPLDGGHRLVTFATPPDLFEVHEADEDGRLVWRLYGDGLISNFRAVPWPSLAGEERVTEMP